MFRIQGEIVIERAAEALFDFVADERNEPRYNPRMRRAEKVSPGPIGEGTRFRAEMAGIGRGIQMETVLTAYERPRRLASASRLALMDTRGTLTFEPVAAGTRMRWSWEAEPRGAFKLAAPLIARVGRRQESENWAGLKRYLE